MPFNDTSNDTQQADVPPVPAQEQQDGTNQPRYVTDEQLSQALNQVQQKMDNLFHNVQSRTDRVEDRVKKWSESAKAQGITLTESQRKLMEDTALIQTLQEDSNAQQPQGPVPGQGQPTGNVDPRLIERINLAADTMMLAANISIDESDPENTIIVSAESGTPKEYLSAVQKAIDAKQARLGGSPQAAIPQPGAPKSPGLVKGVPQSNPIENIKDPNELWKLATKTG